MANIIIKRDLTKLCGTTFDLPLNLLYQTYSHSFLDEMKHYLINCFHETEIFKWLTDNLRNDFDIDLECNYDIITHSIKTNITCGFFNKEDYIMFKLRWEK